MQSHNLPIKIVIDPAHQNWILGGFFQDVIDTFPSSFGEKIEIKSLSLRDITNLVEMKRKLAKNHLLFSSITPLVNYLRLPGRQSEKSISLWFTHKEGRFTFEERRALRMCDFIFVHSAWEVEKLSSFTKAKIIPLIGAISRRRFQRPSLLGNRIVIVGTPSPRKNPHLIKFLVQELKDVDFLLLGKSWVESQYWSELKECRNLSYQEVMGPIESHNLDGCSEYLCLSSIEGGPLPLLETMAAGLIPISTPVGISRDLFPLIDLEQNFLLDISVDQISKKIREIRKNSYSFSRTRIREIALSYSFETFTSKIAGLILSDKEFDV